MPAAGPRHQVTPNTDIWAIFRALRDARGQFGLRPGHMQTLQAMLSFLKPGHGETVFASNFEICRRIGGIDERTLRRHIDRFIELGFMTRHDSPNRKRYRIRATNGQCISFGLSLAPLMERADEILTIAQELENDRRDAIFLRKQILTILAQLEEANPENPLLSETRKILRRKLSVTEYRHLLASVSAKFAQMSTVVDLPKTTVLSANDGQTARYQSKSEEIGKEKEQPELQTLIATCNEATTFTTRTLRSWEDVEAHARILAPMMGIHAKTYEKATSVVGKEKAASAIFIILQLGKQVRNLSAYFQAITLGRRAKQFNPSSVLQKLGRAQSGLA